MASNAKKKTTMAKLNRENAVRERRLRKQARKDARKHAAAHPPVAHPEPIDGARRWPAAPRARRTSSGAGLPGVPAGAIARGRVEPRVPFEAAAASAVALLYAADGDRLVLIASNGGAPRHPGWYHNVLARPEVHFVARDGVRRAYRAGVADGAERARRWLLAADVYDGYTTYQRRTPARRILVVVLAPADHG